MNKFNAVTKVMQGDACCHAVTTSQRFITPLDANTTLYLNPVLGRTEILFYNFNFLVLKILSNLLTFICASPTEPEILHQPTH